MAVVSLKSGVITNRDASPAVMNSGAASGGSVRSAVGYVLATALDDIGSKYNFFSIPSNARVIDLKITCADQGTGGDADVGLYQTTANGGAVVDADFFASALDINAAALSNVDISHESGAFALSESEKMVWQALGLTSDPGVQYDVVATLTEANSDGGAIVLKCNYAI